MTRLFEHELLAAANVYTFLQVKPKKHQFVLNSRGGNCHVARPPRTLNACHSGVLNNTKKNAQLSHFFQLCASYR